VAWGSLKQAYGCKFICACLTPLNFESEKQGGVVAPFHAFDSLIDGTDPPLRKAPYNPYVKAHFLLFIVPGFPVRTFFSHPFDNPPLPHKRIALLTKNRCERFPQTSIVGKRNLLACGHQLSCHKRSGLAYPGLT